MPATTTPTIEQLLEQGQEHHRNNRLNEAEAVFRQILTRQPMHADALYYLGAVMFGRNQAMSAIELINRAIQINPKEFLYHGNLGVLLATQGKVQEAITVLSRALELNPQYSDGYMNIGSAYFQTGKLDEAIAAYKKALEFNPGQLEAANGLARIYFKRENYDETIEAYKMVLAIKPDSGETYANLGAVLCKRNRHDEAVEAYKKSTEVRPDQADAWTGYGFALQHVGRLDEAIQAIRKAVELQPYRPVIHGNLGMLLLLKGYFEEGWREYEWRAQTREWNRDPARERFVKPRWEGEDISGKTILLHSEQGFGDTIHFARYAAKIVKERGGKVIIECYEAIQRLLRTVPGVSEVVVAGKPLPEFDVQSSLMSLPMLFNTSLPTIPAEMPYMFADPETVEKFRQRIAETQQSGLKIGIAWCGQPKHDNDKERSIQLAALAPLAEAVPDARFYSLQKEDSSKQSLSPPVEMRLTDWTGDITDFYDLAAMMMNMDLIISVDTAPAHLAGALGKRTWMLTPANPDWRWLLNRNDSPWYPTLRLFRKPKLGSWSPVVERIAQELKALANKK